MSTMNIQNFSFVSFEGRQNIINLFYDWLRKNNIHDENENNEYNDKKDFLNMFIAWLYSYEYKASKKNKKYGASKTVIEKDSVNEGVRV